MSSTLVGGRSAALALPMRKTGRAPKRSSDGLVKGSGSLLPALASSALLWASLPPVDAWPLAWIAPAGWLWLCLQPTLPGRRPWLAIWFSGFVFWLATLHWLRLPHPAVAIGWIALSFYFAFYIPVFVWLTRRAVHAWRLPLVLAAPAVWTGLELLRGHLLTGLTYASLGHTQYRWLPLIQIADLGGAYAVSFLVMSGAAGLVSLTQTSNPRLRLLPGAAALFLLVGSLGYGYWRLADRSPFAPGPTIALVQGSIDTQVKSDPNQRFEIYEQYLALSRRAIAEHADLDLLVWPETMFREPLITFSADFEPPPDAEWTADDARYAARRNLQFLSQTAHELDTALVLGVDRQHLCRRRVEHYNAAVHVDRQGKVLGRYEKVHPVMFGEYIPFADRIPGLYGLTPLAAGITAGAGPTSFQIGSFRAAANICFENNLPHLIRNQVTTLARRGLEPQLLINLTNDGWFWGSSELDLHLMSAVFRSVEMRKPLLIAANTGFSAVISSTGQILAQGPRRQTAVVSAPVSVDARHTWYARWGDLPSGACLALCGLLAAGPVCRRLTPRAAIRRQRESSGAPPVKTR